MVYTDDTQRIINDRRSTTPVVGHKLPTDELKIGNYYNTAK